MCVCVCVLIEKLNLKRKKERKNERTLHPSVGKDRKTNPVVTRDCFISDNWSTSTSSSSLLLLLQSRNIIFVFISLFLLVFFVFLSKIKIKPSVRSHVGCGRRWSCRCLVGACRSVGGLCRAERRARLASFCIERDRTKETIEGGWKVFSLSLSVPLFLFHRSTPNETIRRRR